MFWTISNALSSVFSAIYGVLTHSNGKSMDELRRENEKLREDLSDKRESCRIDKFIIGIVVFLSSFILFYLVQGV